MLRTGLVALLTFIGCAGPSRPLLILTPQKSYPELLEEYRSCTGKGSIDTSGPIRGILSFTYKSQRDSTFFQFTDALGRKALLMWITPNTVTARNLIDNKQYGYDQIMDFFPFLKIMEPSDITEFLWGVEPDYKEKFKSVDPSITQHIVLEFSSEKMGEEPRALVAAKFQDKESNQTVRVKIRNRNRTTDYVNLKKVWKLLQY